MSRARQKNFKFEIFIPRPCELDEHGLAICLFGPGPKAPSSGRASRAKTRLDSTKFGRVAQLSSLARQLMVLLSWASRRRRRPGSIRGGAGPRRRGSSPAAAAARRRAAARRLSGRQLPAPKNLRFFDGQNLRFCPKTLEPRRVSGQFWPKISIEIFGAKSQILPRNLPSKSQILQNLRFCTSPSSPPGRRQNLRFYPKRRQKDQGPKAPYKRAFISALFGETRQGSDAPHIRPLSSFTKKGGYKAPFDAALR